MKRISRILLTAVAIMAAAMPAMAQTRALGLVYAPEEAAKIPKKPQLITRDFEVLPSSASLFRYCPVPGDQEQYGTCTSWASTYHARTIAEAIKQGWTDRQAITREAFAPLFIYHQIRFHTGDDCQNGTNIEMALQKLMFKGAPKYNDFRFKCVSSIPSDIFAKATPYTIDDYFQLYDIYDDAAKKIRNTKKALAENRPVVFGMNVPQSFMAIGNGQPVWNKTETNNDGGGHAMCVVGYDDNKYGGAFQIMNSWGPKWAENGFVWVRYKDYAANAKYGYEMYVKPKEQPKPKPKPSPAPAPVQGKNKFAGSMRFHLSTGADMTPVLSNGVYNMRGSYISGTRYRIYLSNNEPAYVYVIASDNTRSVSKVFPPDERTSPALVYKSNDIALPDEKWFIEMDDTTGTDNICVLYSQNPLDINAVMAAIERGTGSFDQRVRAALGTKAVTGATFAPSQISFTAQSDATVVPVFVNITHI